MSDFKLINGIMYSEDLKTAVTDTNMHRKEYVLESSIKRIETQCFYANNVIEHIVLPTTNPLIIEDRAFENCKALKEIVVPKNVIHLGNATFNNCTSLEKVILEANIKAIGPFTFTNCESLKEIVIPEGVERIHENAFYNCFRLKKVILPKSLKQIDRNVFRQCLLLKSITIPKDVKIKDVIFDNTIEKIIIDRNTLIKLPYFKSLYEGKFVINKTLDELLEEGKSLHEISRIYKIEER